MKTAVSKPTARDVMTTHVVTIRHSEKVHDALELMAENHVTWLPVVDREGRCVGVISQTDLIALAHETDEESDAGRRDGWVSAIFSGARLSDITHERIDAVMSDEVVSVLPEEPLSKLATLMFDQRIHHVPVCDPDRKLLGVVSTMDILKLVRETF